MDTRSLWSRIPAAFRLALIAVVVVGLLAFSWFYGVKAWNGFGNWMFHHSTTDAHKQIDQLKQEAAQQKQIAAEAIGAFEAEKLVTAEERKKREIAEKLLADKTKATDQKIKILDEILTAPPTQSGPESPEQICIRARAFGIKC